METALTCMLIVSFRSNWIKIDKAEVWSFPIIKLPFQIRIGIRSKSKPKVKQKEEPLHIKSIIQQILTHCSKTIKRGLAQSLSQHNSGVSESIGAGASTSLSSDNNPSKSSQRESRSKIPSGETSRLVIPQLVNSSHLAAFLAASPVRI